MKLYHGDCLDILPNLADKSVDMILCDLPYGCTRNKWDVVIPIEKLWPEYERIAKDNAPILLFCNQPFTAHIVLSNLKMYRYELIWEKPQGTDFLNANRKPLKNHENIEVFYKKQPHYNKAGGFGKPYKQLRSLKPTPNWGSFTPVVSESKDGRRCRTTVFHAANPHAGNHPTEKPVKLLSELIETYTDAGAIVLDNCMGSGSTGVACVETGRDFIGIEKDNKYFEIAKERIGHAKRA